MGPHAPSSVSELDFGQVHTVAHLSSSIRPFHHLSSIPRHPVSPSASCIASFPPLVASSPYLICPSCILECYLSSIHHCTIIRVPQRQAVSTAGVWRRAVAQSVSINPQQPSPARPRWSKPPPAHQQTISGLSFTPFALFSVILSTFHPLSSQTPPPKHPLPDIGHHAGCLPADRSTDPKGRPSSRHLRNSPRSVQGPLQAPRPRMSDSQQATNGAMLPSYPANGNSYQNSAYQNGNSGGENIKSLQDNILTCTRHPSCCPQPLGQHARPQS
jgi:hypothetical protein